MSSLIGCTVRNAQTIPFSEVPFVGLEEFRDQVIGWVNRGARLSSFFGMRSEDQAATKQQKFIRLVAVLADDAQGILTVLATEVEKNYAALTPDCPQAQMFEREIAEQWGVIPEGHPWLRPARFHASYRAGLDLWPNNMGQPALPGVADFFRVTGEEVHEVAVGPVHAGVIEPGHFRFQCHGEKVFHLEISLGYQHRGIERALYGGPHKRTLYQMETAAGDTTIGHMLAYCQALESLGGCKVSARADALRAVGLELERLANHTGDLGALSGDIGFLPSASYCGRIRGDFLNMTALICGSRLGRGFIVPGGVRFDLDSPERLAKLCLSLEHGAEDARVAIELLLSTPGVLSRFKHTGTVSLDDCLALGLVGPAARACGAALDIRRDFPLGQYRLSRFPVVLKPEEKTGTVAARAAVRWAEIQESLNFLRGLVPALPMGAVRNPEAQNLPARLAPNSLTVSLSEGWRGEICHTAITDAQGRFAHYKIVDPSFHNWIGLGLALRNQAISDFPLCNKSFNLSYCGFDL